MTDILKKVLSHDNVMMQVAQKEKENMKEVHTKVSGKETWSY